MSRSSRRQWPPYVVAAVALCMAACGRVVSVEGPAAPPARRISSVLVTPLANTEHAAQTVTAPAMVSQIISSPAFSAGGWVEADSQRVVPLYRIDLRTDTSLVAVYWLGANSHPAQFPCYALCNGWWLASADASGDVDRSRYKPLPESVSLSLLRDLKLP